MKKIYAIILSYGLVVLIYAGVFFGGFYFIEYQNDDNFQHSIDLSITSYEAGWNDYRNLMVDWANKNDVYINVDSLDKAAQEKQDNLRIALEYLKELQ